MRFRIKLYREMKLWLIGAPVLALVAWGVYGASVARAGTAPGGWGRAYWDILGGMATLTLLVGSIAMVVCTFWLLLDRLMKSRFAEWFTTDD